MPQLCSMRSSTCLEVLTEGPHPSVLLHKPWPALPCPMPPVQPALPRWLKVAPLHHSSNPAPCFQLPLLAIAYCTGLSWPPYPAYSLAIDLLGCPHRAMPWLGELNPALYTLVPLPMCLQAGFHNHHSPCPFLTHVLYTPPHHEACQRACNTAGEDLNGGSAAAVHSSCQPAWVYCF